MSVFDEDAFPVGVEVSLRLSPRELIDFRGIDPCRTVEQRHRSDVTFNRTLLLIAFSTCPEDKVERISVQLARWHELTADKMLLVGWSDLAAYFSTAVGAVVIRTLRVSMKPRDGLPRTIPVDWVARLKRTNGTVSHGTLNIDDLIAKNRPRIRSDHRPL